MEEPPPCRKIYYQSMGTLEGRKTQSFYPEGAKSKTLCTGQASCLPSKGQLSRAVVSVSCPGSINPLAQISTASGRNRRLTTRTSQLFLMQLPGMLSRGREIPDQHNAPSSEDSPGIFCYHGRGLRSVQHVPLPWAHLPWGPSMALLSSALTQSDSWAGLTAASPWFQDFVPHPC